MISKGNGMEPLLVVGEGKLAYSVTVCFLESGYSVSLCTGRKQEAVEQINRHLADLSERAVQETGWPSLEITDGLAHKLTHPLVVVITDEDREKKRALLVALDGSLPAHSIIAINSESIPLSELQEHCGAPQRIIGVNWTEPAHTTHFLEIVFNDKNEKALVDTLCHQAKNKWKKDPYIIYDDLGIRSKMMAAMTREAFYLVENGFASMEDIDRACRNDAGYYLPFAGNFRYMDLMGGASAFARVMHSLNPELSKAQAIPDFFADLVLRQNPSPGSDRDPAEERFRRFSYEIQSIIDKYPFEYRDTSSGGGVE